MSWRRSGGFRGWRGRGRAAAPFERVGWEYRVDESDEMKQDEEREVKEGHLVLI